MIRCAALCITALFVAVMPASASDPVVVRALNTAVDRNVQHARDWLKVRDFKSLAQSAGGLELLSSVFQSQSDDPAWQAAAKRVSTAAQAVRLAAQAEDADSAAKGLTALSDACAAAAKLTPTGQSQPPPKANLRSLMLVMDGVRGEAKIALIAGNVENAKNQAHVLSQLGRVVSNLRSGERWSRLSEEYTEASLAAARSSATDPAELRPLLKAVSQRCDACHDTR